MICRWFNVVSNMIAFLQFAAVFAFFFFSLLTNFLLSELFARRLKLKISVRNKSQHTIRDPDKSPRLIRDPNIFTFPEVDRALREERISINSHYVEPGLFKVNPQHTKRAPSFGRRGREIHHAAKKLSTTTAQNS